PREVGGGSGCRYDRRDAQRWNADPIVQLQAQLWANAAAVHPHFTFANDPVYAAPGDRAEAPLETVVEALAGLVLTHLEMLHFGAGSAGISCRHGVFFVRHCFYNGLSGILYW